MKTVLINKNGQAFLECLPDGWILAGEAEALELVAACGESGTQRLLLHADSLADEFYNLRSGAAGAILLKFSNYRLRVALVAPRKLVDQGRFREAAIELNRGSHFRIFDDQPAAEQWLTANTTPEA